MMTVPRIVPAEKPLGGIFCGSRSIGCRWGRPMSQRKERVRALWEPPGHRSKHPGKDSQVLTSGKAIAQQGLTTTCKDPRYKAKAEVWGRDLVWRMSPYKRRTEGNAFGKARRRRPYSKRVIPEAVQRGSGHLAVSCRPRTQCRNRSANDEPVGKLMMQGCMCVST